MWAKFNVSSLAILYVAHSMCTIRAHIMLASYKDFLTKTSLGLAFHILKTYDMEPPKSKFSFTLK